MVFLSMMDVMLSCCRDWWPRGCGFGCRRRCPLCSPHSQLGRCGPRPPGKSHVEAPGTGAGGRAHWALEKTLLHRGGVRGASHCRQARMRTHTHTPWQTETAPLLSKSVQSAVSCSCRNRAAIPLVPLLWH